MESATRLVATTWTAGTANAIYGEIFVSCYKTNMGTWEVCAFSASSRMGNCAVHHARNTSKPLERNDYRCRNLKLSDFARGLQLYPTPSCLCGPGRGVGSESSFDEQHWRWRMGTRLSQSYSHYRYTKRSVEGVGSS